jgi:N-ethylmaleimide reductase
MTTPAATSLFRPFALGPLTLSNRLVMAPMTRSRADGGERASSLAVSYYRQRASAGLIVTEGTQVSLQGVGYPGTPGIYTEDQAAAWKRVTDAVHAEGGRIFAQLWHVGRISHPRLQPGGALPVAPSAIRPRGELYTPGGPRPFETPRALAEDEIAGIVAQFKNAAVRARQAGFDGAELHGANGYLLDQFLRDGSNQRTDRYGGSVENRARLLIEVTRAVASVLGADRVGVRVSPTGTFNDMSDSDPRRTFSHAARALGQLGIAYLHVVEPVAAPPAAGQPTQERITPHLREAFGKGTLIANGGYDRANAEAVIERGEADLVSFGVPFLANPDLVARLAQGAPLNPPDRATFYTGGARGYTDYPTLAEAAASAA